MRGIYSVWNILKCSGLLGNTVECQGILWYTFKYIVEYQGYRLYRAMDCNNAIKYAYIMLGFDVISMILPAIPYHVSVSLQQLIDS